jgi:hypothetical protein
MCFLNFKSAGPTSECSYVHQHAFPWPAHSVPQHTIFLPEGTLCTPDYHAARAFSDLEPYVGQMENLDTSSKHMQHFIQPVNHLVIASLPPHNTLLINFVFLL